MSLSYVIKEGIAGFRRARLASLTSIFSLFIAVVLLGILARISYNAYEVAQSLKSSIDVEVFLLDMDDRSIGTLERQLRQQLLIEEVHYISKDSAAAIFQKEFGSEGSSLADLGFLPASFKLKITPEASIEQVQELIVEIEDYAGVDEIKFNRQLLEVIESRFQTVVIGGIGVGSLILLAALILVFNTIRLTIYAKRNLIRAMKLVGATNRFIRRPFIVEGVIQGLIAGVSSVLMVYLLFRFLLPLYIPQFGILEWPFGRWYYLCGAMILLSVMMGYLGSQWAAHKFIRETSISE